MPASAGNTDYQRALETAGRLLGKPLDLPLAEGEPTVGEDFRRLATVATFGQSWPRPGLDDRSRALISVTIAATREFADTKGIKKDAFEFQMLFGIRRDLQAELSAAGYRFRVYVPFGTEWFPYFMRRLGERPANVGFIVRSLAREK